MVKKKQHETHKKSHTHTSKEHAHKSAKHKTGTHKQAHHKHKEPSSDALKNAAIIVLSLALISVLIWAFTNDGQTSTTKTSGVDVTATSGVTVSPEIAAQMEQLADDDPYLGAEDAPIVMVEFSDFECPYCGKFWAETLPDIKKNFVDTGLVKFVYRDLALSFHANAQKAAEAAHCAGEQEKFWEYHDVLYANQQSLDENSLKKYAVDIGLDVTAFNECLTSGKYTEEVQADAAAANENGISGTPGFVINGQVVSGARPYSDFEQIICALAPEAEPCANIEPPVEFTGTIITDKTCTTCDTSGIVARTKELFPGLSFKTIDASSAEAKTIIQKEGLIYAPAYLFPETITETKMWTPDIANFFVKTTDGYRLKDEATGATWFLSEEAQAAYFKELNEMLGIVKDDNKPQVDFFVMSYCPYGNQAEELLEPVFDKLKDHADFNPRYVVYGQGDGCYTDTDGTQLCSLHGEVELNQNIRELCVLDEYGIQAWFDFATDMNTACTSSNADTCWTDVAENLGYDTAKVESCFEDKKIEYARKDYDLNQALGVSGSPTLFFEGEKYNGERTSNGYLAALCAVFDEAPAVCDDVIAEVPQEAAPQGSC